MMSYSKCLMRTDDFQGELKNWINGDPYREALLVSEAPVAMATLTQIKSGRYRPSDELVGKIRTVMRKFPKGISIKAVG